VYWLVDLAGSGANHSRDCAGHTLDEGQFDPSCAIAYFYFDANADTDANCEANSEPAGVMTEKAAKIREAQDV
jgi:hypothetical protein